MVEESPSQQYAEGIKCDDSIKSLEEDTDVTVNRSIGESTDPDSKYTLVQTLQTLNC